MIASLQYRHLLSTESKIYREIRLESLKIFPEAFGATYQEALQTKNSDWKTILKRRQPTDLFTEPFQAAILLGYARLLRMKITPEEFIRCMLKRISRQKCCI